MIKAKDLQAKGHTQREISEKLGVCERTVRNYLKNPPASRKNSRRESKLASYYSFIDAKIKEQPYFNCEILYDDLRKIGYTGRISILRDYVKKVRREVLTEAVIRFETVPGHQAQVDWNIAFQEFKYKTPINMSRDSINVIVNQEIGILNTEKSNITLTITTSDAFKSKINLIHQLHFGSGIVFNDDTKVASKFNGNLVLGNDTLDVLPVFLTMGDVSSETGNIVFLGTVIVQGDIQPGYKVKADGNVFVYGKADPDSIEAGGDVFIYNEIKE